MVKKYSMIRIQKKHAEIFKQIKNSNEDLKKLSNDAILKLLMEKYILEENINLIDNKEQEENKNV